jgi:hypothetical protein
LMATPAALRSPASSSAGLHATRRPGLPAQRRMSVRVGRIRG